MAWVMVCYHQLSTFMCLRAENLCVVFFCTVNEVLQTSLDSSLDFTIFDRYLVRPLSR